MKRLLTIFPIFLLVVLACSSPVALAEPLPEWQAWYAMSEQCAGLHGNVEAVSWYLLPGDSLMCGGVRTTGCWKPPHTIAIAEYAPNRQQIVMHEALHDILRGGADHPPIFATCGV